MSTPLADLLLNDRGFVFDPASGETFQLNTTGLRILRMLQQGMDKDVAVLRMTQEYEVDEHAAGRDIDDFLREFNRFGLKS